MRDPDTTPTVTLRALVADRCNFLDGKFERFVTTFMDRFLPGFPLGLLDTSSEIAHERWEIVEDDPMECITESQDGRHHVDWNGYEETFDHEEEAFDFVRERMEESRYGFPWAWSWAFLPDERITNDELREAGFTVATYTGGEGGRAGDQYRLCGIDAGGYSFRGAHFATLCAIVHGNRSWTVPTNDGPAYITVGE